MKGHFAVELTLKALIVAAFALTSNFASAQSSVNLTLDEARQAAVNLLLNGETLTAYQLSQGLLQADPNDRTALVVMSAAARQLGQPKIGRQAGAQAYRISQPGIEKYQAARLTALAAAEEGRFTLAQYWLRLARQHAPNEAEAASVAQDYQVLRQRNPWSSNLSFGVAPSGNINGGSQGNTAYLEGNVDPSFAAFLAAFGIYDPNTGLRLLGDNERALSGYEASLSFGTQYRLNQTPTSATFLSAQANVSRYWLSDEARAQSPTSENGDFDRDSLSFGLSHIQVMAENMRPTTFSLGLGGNLYAGSPSSRYVTASVSQPYLLSDRDLLTLSGTVSVSANYNDEIPVTSINTSARLMHILPSGDRVGGSVSVGRNISDIFDSNSNSLSFGVSYSFAKPIYGMGLAFDLSSTFTNIGETRFAPFDREEVSLRAGANVSVPAAEIFGFQPVISFSAEEVRSTVDQFDRTSFGVGLDFRSSF